MYTAKIQEDGIENGQAALKTFEAKYNSSPTREARRASHELFHITKMKSSGHCDDLLQTMANDAFGEYGLVSVPDERSVGIIFQDLSAESKRV